MFGIRLYLEFRYYQNNIQGLSKKDRADQYFTNIFDNRGDDDLLTSLYSIGSTLLWFRIIVLFKLTRFLGPLVKMIQNMLYEIGIFMILYITQLLVFATCSTLLFVDVKAHKDLYTSMKTLFSASLGAFSFDNFKNANRGQTVGDIFLFIFIVVNMILILNLLIAVLSSTYAQLEGKKLVLYINEILQLRSSLEYDAESSSLVSTFPPYNIVPFIASPFIMLNPYPRKVNKVLYHIEYIPLLILITIVYVGLNLILLPLAYIKGIYVTFQQLWSNKIKSNF